MTFTIKDIRLAEAVGAIDALQWVMGEMDLNETDSDKVYDEIERLREKEL